MARTPITPTVLRPISVETASTTFQADPAGTATVAGAGNGVSVASGGSWHGYQDMDRVILRLNNATGGALTATIKAGTNPLAPSGGQADLVISIPATSTKWIGPFDSARFAQSDGSLAVDSSGVITVSAFAVQRS